ncbi:tetratricopeptide repeat protein [Pelotalea chapellei]|uniref:Tetratricopeptide repeat protein n=1 Tax=Pelotalea chapellei TaxID=44671 RepID=A0ABS5U4S5_9BACT|nr:hypothetical protein [Pelotalea chapellei]MBT1070644.1 hypothetical protein [Pelotalea chapellei]
MELSPHASAEKEAARAQKELEEGNVLAALACLEKSLQAEDDPSLHSCLGFCMAKERGHVTRGLELCHAAIEREPQNPIHYFYLAKVHLVAGTKEEAVSALRQGAAQGGNPQILLMLQELGTRKPPPLRFLSRDHFLNKYLGKLLGRLGLR